MPASATQSLADRAKKILDLNWRGAYTVPSGRLYPFQWNWDSGFIALGLAHHRAERALEEIRSMFRGQWRSGLLPHIVFHQPNPNYFPGPEVWRTGELPDRPAGVLATGITQPPVFAFVVERISALPCGQTPLWREFVREIFPKILAFHRYLYTRRDPRGEGLVYVQHNWEPGTDNSPAWDAPLDAIDITGMRDISRLRRDIHNADAAHRPTNANYQRYIHLVDLFADLGYRDEAIAQKCPFLVQDVLFNSLLVRSNQALVTLARQIGEPAAEIEAWNAKTIAAIETKLWDEKTGFYYAYDLRRDRPIPVMTNSGFMPLLAGAASPGRAERLARHLVESFAPGPGWRLCASTAPGESAFDPVKYWRGPVWIQMNWLIYHGLRRYGLDDLAARMHGEIFSLLENTGLYENYDPRPGIPDARRGLGANKFSWSASLALDLIHNPAPL